MVSHCIVNTCSTTFRLRGQCVQPEGVRVHRIPSNPARLSAWIDKIRTVNGSTWSPSHLQTARICSLHFAPSAYELERQDGVVKLKWNAVPTVFLACKRAASPSNNPITDHLYSVARDEASRQELRNSRRKVLESIMNGRTPDHVYASRTPFIKIQSPRAECPEKLSFQDDMVRFPSLRVGTSEDSEVIFLDENSSDSIQEVPIQNAEKSFQNPVRTSLINGNHLIELPDGRLANFLSTDTSTETIDLRNTFTDSEVDKLQIKRLSDENRRLQDELSRVRRFAERLLRQHERLKQQNRVTSRAYRNIKKQMERANENLNNPFSDDESLTTRWNQDSDEETVDLREAVVMKTKSGITVCEEIKKPSSSASVRSLQNDVPNQKNGTVSSMDLLDLLAPDIPGGSGQDHSTSSGSYIVSNIVNG